MKKYLVLYRAPQSARAQMANATPEQRKAGMDGWMAWMGRCGQSIVDMGAPLGDSAHVNGSASGDSLGGFSIVTAADLAGAKALLDGHPHLMMPGASIE